MRQAIVFGGSGYAGLELIRLIAGHPSVRLRGTSSNRWAGQLVSSHVPAWSGDDRFMPHDALHEVATEGDVCFLATPAATSHEIAPKMLKLGLSVIDVSGAFRLANSEQYETWYGFKHEHPGLLEEAAYGMPELFAKDYPASPRLIANPGCYPTAAILAVAPLLAADLLDPDAPITIDGKSGATGAGRKLADTLLFSEVAETVKPYKLASHQHTPEMEHYLGLVAKREVQVSFTPHLLSIRRGLLASAYCRSRPGVSQEQINNAYFEMYKGQPFIRVLSEREPHPGAVVYSNHCDVRAQLDPRTGMILAFGAIDNLIKGAAGQAIQNLNAILGLDPTTGLLHGASR